MAMKIGGADDIRNVQRNNWERFARAMKLPPSRVSVWLLEQMEAIVGSLPTTVAYCAEGYGDSPIYQNILEICERRAGQLERELVGAGFRSKRSR
jgi:hypothetical protein